jgi:hypothetical protein
MENAPSHAASPPDLNETGKSSTLPAHRLIWGLNALATILALACFTATDATALESFAPALPRPNGRPPTVRLAAVGHLNTCRQASGQPEGLPLEFGPD